MSKFFSSFSIAVAAILTVGSNLVVAQQVVPVTNFAQVAVGASSSPQTVSFTGVPTVVSFSQTIGTDFSVNPTCNGSGSCTAAITFTPTQPGLRQDAVLVTNSQGNVVGIAAVYGIGTAPQTSIAAGIISTVASRATSGLGSATLNGVALVKPGNLFVSDDSTNTVFFINSGTGQVKAFAGNGTAGYSGDGSAATGAKLNLPSALALDSSGDLYIADSGNNVVRKVTLQGVITTVAGNGTGGYNGDNIAAGSAELNSPNGLAVDALGNLYIGDTANNRVREVMATNGQITGSSTIVTVAGNGTAGFSGDAGAATSAQLNLPVGLTVDASGNLFIADSTNEVVRKVTAPIASGTISTVAGTAHTAGYAGDGSAATSALLDAPWAVAVDAGGNLYIADKTNQVVRKVTGDSTHTISTIAGTHTAGYSGDNGSATSATLNAPTALTLDGTSNLYIIDYSNEALREVTATPAPLTFPAAGGSLVLTVSNSGNSPLTFSALSVTSPFTQSSGTCTASTVLAAGAECTVGVSFPGGSTPPASAAVAITDNSLNVAGTQQSVSLTQATGLRFVPITPCRVVDTRNPNDAFSGTFMAGGSSRDFIIPQSPNINAQNCPNVTIPSTALAYSLNIAVVPRGAKLSYLTVWTRGQARPLTSILNSDGRIKSNAAIIGADTSGGISVYATDDTDLVLDVDGYFVGTADTNYSTGLEFYTVPPCRVLDTRATNGPLGGPALTLHGSRDFPILSSSCSANIPSNVKAYSFNIAAVPQGGQPLIYLTAWPTGTAQPLASVLNATTGAITSNATIVPAGTSGNVSVYASNATDVVIDINGYFAPPNNGLSLYPVTPCRVLDTRGGGNPAPFTGTITAPFVSSSCSVPTVAQAYALSATVVPTSSLSYLTLWSQGDAVPLESTLNADDQAITSNLAIVPTTTGSIFAYASSSTYLILDIFGYFAP